MFPQIPKAVTIDTSKVSGKIDLPRVVQQLKKRGFHALRQGTNHCFTMMKIVWYPRPHFTLKTATGQYVVVLGSALGKDPAGPKEENEPPVEPGTAFRPAVQAPPSVSLWTVLAKMGVACTGTIWVPSGRWMWGGGHQKYLQITTSVAPPASAKAVQEWRFPGH